MNFNFQIIYLVIAIIVSLIICVYAWRQNQAHGNKAFAISCLASVFWMLGDVIGRATSSFPAQFFGETIRYIGVTSIPVAVFVFARQYCNKSISFKQIVWLSVIPVISYLMVITSLWHDLFFASMQSSATNAMIVRFGLYFWLVHTPYSYFLILTSVFFVMLEISRVSQAFRPQIIFLLISLCIPLVINIVGLMKVFPGLNYTSLSFPAFLVIMAVGMFRYDFLWSNPIAYESVFQTIKDGVIILDLNNIIRDINPAAARGLNRTPKKIIGQTLRQAFAPWREIAEKYENVAEVYDEVEVELGGAMKFISITISSLKSVNGEINGKTVTFRDITVHKEYQISLETLAFHDPLTRLANRRKFQEEVEKAIKISSETATNFAILFFDLNSFKTVNDRLGHESGDELLKYVAARVSSILRKPDILARFGGDEFAVLLHNTNEDETLLVIERILENVQKPFRVNNHSLTAELSIGAAFYPQHGETLTQLLRNADAAMYRAKAQGGGFVLLESKIKFAGD